MASHQNVNEDYTYGYRKAEEVSKGYKEESSSHKKQDGDVYGYKEPEDVIMGFEEEPHSHDYEKPEDVYGYKEPEEVRFSYKPKVPRCKNGYRLLVGTCIKLISYPGMSWLFGMSHYGAKKACMTEGATLAMPKTEELDVALRHLVKTEGGNKEHWIGMEEKTGTWYWVDGSKVDNNGYTGWTPGDRSNSRWPPLCGQYWEKSPGWLFPGTGYVMWNDDACFKQKRFICQRPPA
ncbi:PREDICTED: asialoglycoprotein receptor 1-like [Branchiostoma belcheri]|uniref:Asialoglycoprotein receptor 1-like n=1 Tax=Branchiostoma belcheri TaxID=7741 RepID=A0A6P5A274_BRABE|nr:PREDICTED: asialoglycoprotein receptor 1-like [Branchiostoma belcheri]